MHTDQHGNRLTVAGDAVVAQYDRAVSELLHFRAAFVDAAGAAVAEDPTFALGHVLGAYLSLMSTEAADAATARAAFAASGVEDRVADLLPRERQHVAVARTWLDGDMHAAGALLHDLTRTHPRDALALFVGHQIDFFTGDATTLRDRVGGALSAWTEDDAHRGPVLGMYAFGLEESGHYDRSEDVGLAALALDRHDVWGVHAVVHTYEMQGRFGEGVRFFDDRLDDWSGGNFLNVHNWWHYALYALEAGDTARALSIYDAVLHHAESPGVALEMLDAAAPLWRLHLDGNDQSERWAVLADAWEPKAGEAFYAFNDAHAVMAFVGAGRFAAARRLVADRERWAAVDRPGSSNLRMTREVGLPVVRALLAFGAGRYGEVVEELMPIRNRVNRFGGSHAQRDAVQRTLLEAALRSGRTDLARALVSERIAVRPCSPYNWLKQADVAEALGRSGAAAAASTRAAGYAAAGGAPPRAMPDGVRVAVPATAPPSVAVPAS